MRAGLLPLTLAAGLLLSRGAAAQAEIECRVSGNLVKATPEVCARLGVAAAAPEPPQAAQPEADRLHAIWEQNRRTGHATAHQAATEYVQRFPAGPHADALRLWIGAYERAREPLQQGAGAADAAGDGTRAALEKTMRDLVLADPRRGKAFDGDKIHNEKTMLVYYGADFKGCTMRLQQAACWDYDRAILNPFIPATRTSWAIHLTVPIHRLDLAAARITRWREHFQLELKTDFDVKAIEMRRSERRQVNQRDNDPDNFCDRQPKPGDRPGNAEPRGQRDSVSRVMLFFADTDAAQRFKSTLEQYAKVCIPSEP